MSETAAPVASAATPSPAPVEAVDKTGAEVAAGPSASEQREAAREAKEAAKRAYKLKIDGREHDVELTDDEIAMRLQKAEAAERRFQEAAEIKKAFQRGVELIKKDPWGALKDPIFGLDMEKLAEERLMNKYRDEIRKVQLEQASPEQKQQLEMQQRFEEQQRLLQEREAELERLRQERQSQEQAAMDAQVRDEYEKTFIEALETQGLPKTPETLWHMADIARLNLEYGVELTPAQMAREVRQRLEGSSQRLVESVRGGLRGDALLNALGESVVKEVLRAAVAKVRPAQQPQRLPASRKPEPEEPAERQIRRSADFWKSIR